MRLVSAVYGSHYPFHNIEKFNEFVASDDPADLREGDCLLVWGGSDIHPSLYGRSLSRFSGASSSGPSQRDLVEWHLMLRAKELSLPIIGICRGAQMLCALAGGTLLQHVNGHGGDHMVVTRDGKEFQVNSLHHQMMYPTGTEHNIVAWSKHIRSDVHYDVDEPVPVDLEPEFIHFPSVKGFAVQWHPEMMNENSGATQYVNHFIVRHL